VIGRSTNTRRRPRGSALLLLLAACAFQATALNPNRDISEYVHDRWGSDQGLPGDVHGITQTSDGYLWIGTERGLFRFDGLTFLPVVDQGPSPVSLSNVDGLTIDGLGNLIVRLPERNLLRYANKKFDNILYSLQPRELAVTAMCRGKDGSILLTGIIQGVLRYSAGRFETIAPAASLPASPIVSMIESADGKIWLGTRDEGLFYLEGRSVINAKGQIPSRKINALLSVGADVWVGTDKGMVRWNGTGITADGIPPSLRNAEVLAMLKDHHSNLWIGGGTGLFRVNAGLLADDHERAGGAVRTLFEDREGSLWAGGPSGIERWRDSNFITYGKPEGLPSDHNGPIYADSQGRVWFAPLEGGLVWMKGGQRGRVVEDGLGADVVYSVAGNQDDLWIGRQRGGLTHLRYRGSRLVAETFTQAGGLARNSISSVYQSRDGTVWAGTLSGGVSRYRGGKFTTFSIVDGLASNTVNSILEDSDETMWFATPNGVRAFSNETWRGYTVKEGLPSDEVNCLLKDSRGVLWIGTTKGLAFLNLGSVRTPQTAVDLLHDSVFGLAQDKAGWLWITTSKHVARVNRDKLLGGALAEGDLREYAIGDGLRSAEGVRRDRSVVADPQGRIWLSMNTGLSVADPAQLTDNSVPADVQIQSIKADNNFIDLSGPVRVPARPGRITFAYSAVSLSEPERVQFQYRLDRYDSGWNKPTSDREANYTNIGPGSHRFRVVARNPDGVWNSTEDAVVFEVQPTFWQTWWFRLAAVLAAGLALLALYRLRLQFVATRLNLMFEERLAERTRIARELHDTLLQGFLSASMQLHVAEDVLPADSPAKNSLHRIVEQVRGVIDEGRNAIRGLRSSKSVSLDLEEAFSQMQQELQVPDGIRFRVIVDGRRRPLHPILRDEVYRIGREALVNALRHSGASEIDLEIKYAANQMRLLVRDNGRGIDPEALAPDREGHLGLVGIRERAEKIGCRLRVWSRVSGGTEVELSVPGKIAFQDSPSNAAQRLFRRKSNGVGRVR
jgi:ligand-binding sensor domain-containing protein